MISYCGIECNNCEGYLATQSGNKAEQQKVAESWTNLYGSIVKINDILCDGCRTEKRKSRHCKETCQIRKCVISKNLHSCIECESFPCEDVNYILENVPDAMQNLNMIKI